jgi:hypothetical protein
MSAPLPIASPRVLAPELDAANVHAGSRFAAALFTQQFSSAHYRATASGGSGHSRYRWLRIA